MAHHVTSSKLIDSMTPIMHWVLSWPGSSLPCRRNINFCYIRTLKRHRLHLVLFDLGSAIVHVGETVCDTYIICQESHFVVTLDNLHKFERKQLFLTSVELQSVALADQTQPAVLTNSSATLDQKFNLFLFLLLPWSGLKLEKHQTYPCQGKDFQLMNWRTTIRWQNQ